MIYPDYLEINVDRPYFSKQFCNDIINGAKLDYNNWYGEIRSDLKLYDKDEKLKIIRSKIDKIRKNLEKSDYKTYLSVKDVKNSLDRWLAIFFSVQFIAEATTVTYKKSLRSGKYRYNDENRILTVHPTIDYFYTDTKFDFSLLDEFKPLVKYVAWCMFFNKLKKMEEKIIEPKIAPTPEKKNKKQIVNIVIPILAADDNGNFIHEPLSLEENYNEKDVQIIEESDMLEDKYIENNNKNKNEDNSLNKDIRILSSEADIKEQNELSITQIKQQPLYLANVFESVSKYNYIMGILVQQKLIRELTHLWIDEHSNKKKFLVVILKQLHSLGYYKNNQKLSHKQIIEISQNTFGLKMGIDSVKKTPHDYFIINFLPFASTLDL